MKEVRVKERKMKWPLMSNGSSQQQTRQMEKSASPLGISGDARREQHVNHPYATSSAALNITSPDSKCVAVSRQMNILLILALIGFVFGFGTPELDAFNNEIIDLNSEFKFEKSGLKNYCDVSLLPTNNIIGVTFTPSFNLTPTGVGFAEFNNLRCEFNGVSAATAPATIATNENKNKNIFESGPVWGHTIQTKNHTQHPNAPRIDRKDAIDQTDIACCEFDNIECIFDTNMDGIGLQYYISFGMCFVFSLLFFSFLFFFFPFFVFSFFFLHVSPVISFV